MRRLSMKIARATFDKTHLYIALLGGGVVAVPLAWYPPLAELPDQQRNRWELQDRDEVLYWPALDVRISVPYLFSRSG